MGTRNVDRVVAETTERVLDEAEAFLIEEDRSLWDGERLNIKYCMDALRERLLASEDLT